jgi:hypothetical protein
MGLERKLRWAGFLVALSLVVQIATSTVVHPLAFVAFLMVACPLGVAGMLLFLWAIATGR